MIKKCYCGLATANLLAMAITSSYLYTIFRGLLLTFAWLSVSFNYLTLVSTCNH